MRKHSLKLLRKWIGQGFVLVTGMVMLAGPVLAQVAVIEIDPKPAPKPFDLDLGYGYLANTDLKKSSGDFHRNTFRGADKRISRLKPHC